MFFKKNLKLLHILAKCRDREQLVKFCVQLVKFLLDENVLVKMLKSRSHFHMLRTQKIFNKNLNFSKNFEKCKM